MAIMIPDGVLSGSSRGEQLVFGLLQRLPQEYIVFYEPRFAKKAPDFVIIAPDIGVLVIEVKGWYAGKIKHASRTVVEHIDRGGNLQKDKHPVEQARNYTYALVDHIRNMNGGEILFHSSGPLRGKPNFAFAWTAVLSNISQTQLHNSGHAESFPESENLTRDKLDELCNSSIEGQDLVKALKIKENFLRGAIRKLSTNQINQLNAAIHPETVIKNDYQEEVRSQENNDRTVTPIVNLKVLDTKQQQNVRKIGDGHQVVKGVAGSGKTLLLLARVRLLVQRNSNQKILVLCFNRALASFLRKTLKDLNANNLLITHFDGYSKLNGVTRLREENNTDLGERLLQSLQSGNARYSEYFDSVFVDEAQDFEPNWFKCVIHSMADQADGDLLIVVDDHQSLFERSRVSWKSVGIKASGSNTIYKRLNLDKNYRNTKEIIKVASLFTSSVSQSENEDNTVPIPIDLDACIRSNGIKPKYIQAATPESESNSIKDIIQGLLKGNYLGKRIKPLKAKEIGILYSRCPQGKRSVMLDLVHSLSNLDNVLWLNDPQNRRIEEVDFNGIKIITIKSSKGLQFKAVIFMWADQLPLPSEWQGSNENIERKEFYVALTRAEDYLIITSSGQSVFLDKLKESNLVDIS